MPHGVLEYGVLYHIEQGPNRERVYDALRLGSEMDSRVSRISFEFRGNNRDYIGPAVGWVHGVHRLPNDMLLVWGKLPKQPDGLNSKAVAKIWHQAFYFAQYNLRSHKGRIVLNEKSLFGNALDQFGPYKETEDEL